MLQCELQPTKNVLISTVTRCDLLENHNDKQVCVCYVVNKCASVCGPRPPNCTIRVNAILKNLVNKSESLVGNFNRETISFARMIAVDSFGKALMSDLPLAYSHLL